MKITYYLQLMQGQKISILLYLLSLQILLSSVIRLNWNCGRINNDNHHFRAMIAHFFDIIYFLSIRHVLTSSNSFWVIHIKTSQFYSFW